MTYPSSTIDKPLCLSYDREVILKFFLMTTRILLGVLTCMMVAAGVYLLYSFDDRETVTQDERVYHVGILNAFNFFSQTVDGFKEGMSELGYIEGKNIVYDLRESPVYTGNDAILEEFVHNDVDMIFVFPTDATLEAKKATEGTDIPVLFSGVIVETPGVIESIQRPGGNLTGGRLTGTDNAVTRFEIMRQIVPEAKRYMVPFHKGYPTVEPALKALRPIAEAEGITLIEQAFDTDAASIAYFNALSGDEPAADAFILIANPIGATPETIQAISAYAHRHQIPVAGPLIHEDRSGPLFSYSSNNFTAGKILAPVADKIFKGTPAGTIPITTPPGELHINYGLAEEYGIKISEGLLSKATKIVR